MLHQSRISSLIENPVLNREFYYYDRYFELRPQLDRCQARIQQLEGELDRAKEDLTESERRHQSTYLQMFLKGQQAARLQHENEVGIEHQAVEDCTIICIWNVLCSC